MVSQTDVNGPYFSNTTWNISGSPYNLIGDVQIPNGITLTIEPGVVINFNSDYEILIKGNLIANGNNSLPITFNGNISGKSMLIFKDTNLTNSQLTFLEFNGPKNAIQLANESEFNQDLIKNSGTLTISEVTFDNTRISTDGYNTTASLLIENATFTSTDIQGTYPRSEPIEVKNSDFYNSSVNSDSYNYGILINNCTASNTVFSIGCCGANLEFLNSNLTNSAISEGDGNPKVGPVKITQSEFNNTPLNLPAARVEVSSSIFNYDNSNGLIFGNGTFECSQIYGNNSGTALKITGYDGYNIGNSVIVTNSTIKENSIGIDIENANTITISDSNIYGNTSYNVKNSSVENITATDNWWGTTNTNTIESKIYDYYDNINFGIINYSNFHNVIQDISNGCPNIPLSIENLKELSVRIYPNPNKGIVNIDFGNMLQEVSIKVYDSMGRLVYNNENISNQLYQFELIKNPGLYIIELTNQNIKQYHKLIME
jgi:hypothetical protein